MAIPSPAITSRHPARIFLPTASILSAHRLRFSIAAQSPVTTSRIISTPDWFPLGLTSLPQGIQRGQFPITNYSKPRRESIRRQTLIMESILEQVPDIRSAEIRLVLPTQAEPERRTWSVTVLR